MLIWFLIGIIVALISRWIGRNIPLNWPTGIRLVASSGLLAGLILFSSGIRHQLADLLNWFQERLPHRRSTVIIVILLCWVVSGIILMKNSHYIRHDQPSGDEPEYMMLTRSLIDDGDYELEIDKATNVCNEFMTDRFVLDIRSVRPPGLPALLIPAYLWGRHLPWPGLPHSIYLFMGLLYAVLGSQLFLLLQAATDRPRLATALTLTAMLTPPLIPFSFQVYPEIPATILVIFLFRREFYGALERNRWLDGILLALIPIFHQKYLFLFAMSFAHLASGVWMHRKRNPGSWIAIVLPSAASLVLLSIFFGQRFGIWLPTAPYALNEGLLSNIPTLHTLRAVLGQFFDRKWGLFMINPCLLFLIPGMVAIWRRRPWMWLWWVALTGGFVVLVSAYPMWWGGFCPAGRFVLPVVPLMWLAVARVFAEKRAVAHFTTISFCILFALAFFFSGLTMFGSPFKTQNVSPFQYPEESPNGSSLWAAASTCVDWNSVLPAIERNGKWNHILPDNLQFDSRDAFELAIFVFLALLWSVLVMRGARVHPAEPGSNRHLLLPLFYLAAGFGFFLPGHDESGLVQRQRFQRSLSTGDNLAQTGMPGASDRMPDPQAPIISSSNPSGGFQILPGAYGRDDGTWFRAPEPKFDIFYPPIYIQDMPDTLWPGGLTYRFSVPIRWVSTADCGKIGISVQNLLTRHKHIAETKWHPGADETLLEVICPVDAEHRAMFKIILFGDTSQYYYRPLSVSGQLKIEN